MRRSDDWPGVQEEARREALLEQVLELELEVGDPVALVAEDGSVLAVGTLGEDGIVEFAGEEDAPST